MESASADTRISTPPLRFTDKSSLVYAPASYVDPIRLESLFVDPKPVEVELGSGDGSFLAQYAQAHPEHNFVGVERLLGRLRKTDRKGQRAGLRNLRLLRIEASYFLTYLLPPRSIQSLHVYFPDPWPKRRHQQRRLVQPSFLEAAAKALQPGGTLLLRTDDLPYYTHMRTVGEAHPEFEMVDTPLEVAGFVTDFERDFLAQGLPIYRAAYRRR